MQIGEIRSNLVSSPRRTRLDSFSKSGCEISERKGVGVVFYKFFLGLEFWEERAMLIFGLVRILMSPYKNEARPGDRSSLLKVLPTPLKIYIKRVKALLLFY